MALAVAGLLALGVAACADSDEGAVDDTGITAEWLPKLRKLQENDVAADCAQPSDTACSTAIHTTMKVLDGLDGAITDAGAEARFPKTVEQIDKVQDAARTYDDRGCVGDPDANADDSPCHKAALEVATAPTMVDLLLVTDDPDGALDAMD